MRGGGSEKKEEYVARKFRRRGVGQNGEGGKSESI